VPEIADLRIVALLRSVLRTNNHQDL
jgi:hypothetical protein